MGSRSVSLVRVGGDQFVYNISRTEAVWYLVASRLYDEQFEHMLLKGSSMVCGRW